MKIACLGWGSLVWDPRSLHVRAGWFADGPLLPIEFARESKDKRITLVIAPGAPCVRSLWALSSLGSLEAATADLAAREGIPEKRTSDAIGVWKRGGENSADIDPQIANWATRLDLHGVVWTNLKPKFHDQDRMPSEDEVIDHLRNGISHEERTTAERYVRMAPRQVDTPYRRRIELEFGWTPAGGAATASAP
jgi:hypothetical protein